MTDAPEALTQQHLTLAHARAVDRYLLTERFVREFMHATGRPEDDTTRIVGRICSRILHAMDESWLHPNSPIRLPDEELEKGTPRARKALAFERKVRKLVVS